MRATEGKAGEARPVDPIEVQARLRERTGYVAVGDELAQITALLAAMSPLALADPTLTEPAVAYVVRAGPED